MWPPAVLFCPSPLPFPLVSPPAGGHMGPYKTCCFLWGLDVSGRRWDTLVEMKKVARVIGGFDALQAGQVGAVIRLLPVGQVWIDVILVGSPAGVLAHRLPCIVQPGVVRRDNGFRIARIPVRRVLGGEQRVAVYEGRGVRGYAVDRTAECIKPDAAHTERC